MIFNVNLVIKTSEDDWLYICFSQSLTYKVLLRSYWSLFWFLYWLLFLIDQELIMFMVNMHKVLRCPVSSPRKSKDRIKYLLKGGEILVITFIYL